MNITLNGENRTVSAALYISGLLAELELEPRKIAVEHNLEIVPKSAYGTTAIKENDQIEIVQFVGGG